MVSKYLRFFFCIIHSNTRWRSLTPLISTDLGCREEHHCALLQHGPGRRHPRLLLLVLQVLSKDNTSQRVREFGQRQGPRGLSLSSGVPITEPSTRIETVQRDTITTGVQIRGGSKSLSTPAQ